MSEPREYTVEECREMFLKHVWSLVDYWETQGSDSRAKLSGVVFSLLATLDGCSIGVPGFEVCPNPHESDMDYRKKRGIDWWPVDIDIAGGLHEEFHKYDPKEE